MSHTDVIMIGILLTDLTVLVTYGILNIKLNNIIKRLDHE